MSLFGGGPTSAQYDQMNKILAGMLASMTVQSSSLANILKVQQNVLTLLTAIQGQLTQEAVAVSKLGINTQELIDAVKQETDLQASLLTAYQTIAKQNADFAAQLKAAQDNGLDPAEVAAVQKAISDSAAQLRANAKALADATVANTSAASGPSSQPTTAAS